MGPGKQAGLATMHRLLWSEAVKVSGAVVARIIILNICWLLARPIKRSLGARESLVLLGMSSWRDGM